MKKYLLSSLLIIMISIVWAESHFLDMRVGDFGCITRVVFEFTGKIDYRVKEEGNNLAIDLNSLREGKIQLPVEESKNISSLVINESKNSSKINIEFTYPVEVAYYNYFQESKNYIIVIDVYDKGYRTDKEKGLATLLFKGQKFPLSKISTEISEFSKKYSSDTLVNLYLGRLFATKKMKNKAIEYFNKIPEESEQFFTAQAYIDNLNKKRYPSEEVKPAFLELTTEIEVDTLKVKESTSPIVNTNQEEQVDLTEKVIDEKNNSVEKKDDSLATEPPLDQIWLILLGISLFIIILQFMLNIKKKKLIEELNYKLENSIFELNDLANKLEKGVIENSKTKDRIIIKLFNNGWKPQDIANELSTSIEIVEATIGKEGRL